MVLRWSHFCLEVPEGARPGGLNGKLRSDGKLRNDEVLVGGGSAVDVQAQCVAGAGLAEEDVVGARAVAEVDDAGVAVAEAAHIDPGFDRDAGREVIGHGRQYGVTVGA